MSLMTTKSAPGKGRVSVRWKWAADALMQALEAREAYSAHSMKCHTCRIRDEVGKCLFGRDLYPAAIKATEAARRAYQRAREASS